MLRKLLMAAAVLGTCGVIVTALALMATQAFAEAPKCKNKSNKYVACTDKLRAKTQRKKGGVDPFLLQDIKGESDDKRRARRRPPLKQQ